MRTSIVFVALICAVSAVGQDASARQAFEKAAFAEEHERDFEKAAKLYGAAAVAAQSSGDRALADDAKRALMRLEARLGKGTDTKASAQDVPIAVQRRLFLLVKQLSLPKEGEHQMENKNYEAMNQLTPFGAVAVPILERALNSETIEDPDDNSKSPTGGFRGSTHWAARTLVGMEAPEAAAALMRGLKSADPFVRTTVVSNAYAPRHRALLDEAVKEPTLAGLAITRLSYAKDPDLGDLMKSAVLRDDQGGPPAMRWLVRNRRDEAVAAAKGGKIRGETLKAGLEEIVGDAESNRVNSRGNIAPRSSVEIESKLPVLIEIGEALEDPTRVLILIEQVNRLLGSSSQFDPALKTRLEAIALRSLPEAVKENSSETIMKLLGNIGGLPTARALLASTKGPPDDTSYESIRRILSRVTGAQFLEAIEVVNTVASRYVDVRLRSQQLSNLYASLRSSAQAAEPADLAAGFTATPKESRATYLDRVVFQMEQLASTSVLLKVLEAGDETTRFLAAQKLAKYGSMTGEEGALAALVSALSDPSDQVRGIAANSLQAFGSFYQKRLDELVGRQVEAHSADPSNELVWWIRRLPSQDAMPLLEGLWKTAPSQHGLILQVMLEVESDAANAFLVKHFDEIPDSLRGAAIDRFGKAVYEPAIDVIGAQLSSRDDVVRMRAQTALEVFKKQREALEEFKRWKTGSAESRASIGELMKLLDSTNKDVVIGAVRALGAVRAQSALPALVKLLDRNDKELKAAVDEAIKKIGE